MASRLPDNVRTFLHSPEQCRLLQKVHNGIDLSCALSPFFVLGLLNFAVVE
ncbi:hypothetical protein PGB90_000832 [Kerria lacca]